MVRYQRSGTRTLTAGSLASRGKLRKSMQPYWVLLMLPDRLVERPITLNLKQIRDEFEQITVPITVVCAGNRRKEQNVVQKTKGFSWGSAGVSTSIFTGPLMGEVLKRAKPTRRAKYVCMEGADQLVCRSPCPSKYPSTKS